MSISRSTCKTVVIICKAITIISFLVFVASVAYALSQGMGCVPDSSPLAKITMYSMLITVASFAIAIKMPSFVENAELGTKENPFTGANSLRANTNWKYFRCDDCKEVQLATPDNDA